jgi:hypothetical protein
VIHYIVRLSHTGGSENVLSSRKHYSISLNFQNAKLNVRALYGLLMCCKAIKAAEKDKFGGK